LALKAVKVVTLEEPRKDLLHIRSSSSLLTADGIRNAKRSWVVIPILDIQKNGEMNVSICIPLGPEAELIDLLRHLVHRLSRSFVLGFVPGFVPVFGLLLAECAANSASFFVFFLPGGLL
jgi:hypothetical protein